MATEEDTQRGALDAVNAGIAAANGEEETSDTDEQVVESGGEEAPDVEGGEQGAGHDDGADGEDGDSDVAAEDAATVEASGDEEEGEDPPAVSRKDPVNDPLPENLKAETRERIESLVGKVKELNTYREERDTLLNMIKGTGAAPEQFGETLQFLQMVYGENPNPAKAIEWLKGKMFELAAQSEEPIEGVSLLDGFPDLKEAVELADIDEKFAIELAKSRLSKKQAPAPQAAPRLTPDMPIEQARPLGVQQLDELGNELAERDPHYDYKMKQILPQLQQIAQTAHPSTWKEKTLELYALASPPPPKAARKPNNPMRGRQTATPNAKEPGSALEALELGLRQAGSR